MIEEHIRKSHEVAEKFQRVSLKEMDSVTLMNRTDTKFVFNVMQLPAIFEDALCKYKILEIQQHVGQKYETVYFDTKDFDMFKAHQSGQLNRYKIRRREYTLSGSNFLEVKFKSNKGRTIKKRINKDRQDIHFDEDTVEFLDKHSMFSTDNLEEKLTNSFTRFMLVNITAKERITIDVDLSFKNEIKSVHLPFLGIAEVKQEGFSMSSDFIQILKKHGIISTSMSKYCVGAVLLFPQLKYNRFKPKMLTLNKLSNGSHNFKFFNSFK
jgi:hypothetical protein